MGVSTQYLVRIPSGEELTVFSANSGIATPLALAGDVELCWRPDHAFLLERVPGEVIEPVLTT
jgi:spermidine/putrescine transport system ATP-binding protein